MIVRTCDVLSCVESSTIRASLVRAWPGIRCGHRELAAQPVNPGRIVPLISYPRRFRAQPRGASATDRARAPTEIDPRPDGWAQLHRVAHIRLVGEGWEHNAEQCKTPVLSGYRASLVVVELVQSGVTKKSTRCFKKRDLIAAAAAASP